MNDFFQFNVLYEQAVAFVLKHQDTSCSGLQRHLRIGYTLAMQLKDRMQESGVYDGMERHVEPEHVMIKVVGVGDAGCNALQGLILKKFPGVESIAVSTDAHGIARSTADKIIRIGALGDGVELRPQAMRELALQCSRQLEDALRGAHMVFIAAGLGGGAGTGIAPVIAQIAKEQGALSIGVVYTPACYEGERYQQIAAEGVQALAQHIDALFVIPPGNIDGEEGGKGLTEIPHRQDRRLVETVAIFTQMFTGTNNFTSVSFGDLKRLMRKQGRAALGIGMASGIDGARIATEQACAALSKAGIDITAARGLLIVVTASRNSRLVKAKQIMPMVRSCIASDLQIVTNIVLDDAMGGDIRVGLIATGI